MLDAICLLPDHLHCMWTLPENDSDFSTRWALVKIGFTRLYTAACGSKSNGGHGLPGTASRKKKREASLWQRRFWEHLIRNEKDYYEHLDYIHFNPVKHGYVKRPRDWEWSTFQKYVKKDIYPPDWYELPPESVNGRKREME